MARRLTVSDIVRLEAERGVPIGRQAVATACKRGTLPATKRPSRGAAEWTIRPADYRAWSAARRPRGRRPGAGSG